MFTLTSVSRSFLPAIFEAMADLTASLAEIEITGSHTQFYDKFNIRYYITQIFKMVWSNPSHREALRLESLYAVSLRSSNPPLTL